MSIHNRITLTTAKNGNTPTTQVYKGFSTVNTNTNNFKLYDFELIKQDLLNTFYIRQGERLMNPEYGTVIWDLLFEPMTPDVQNSIIQNVNAIFNSDPRIQASNILVTPYETGIQIQCTLKYLVYNIQENLQMQFDQANGLTS
jgi:phage baseplate assembly protein W